MPPRATAFHVTGYRYFQGGANDSRQSLTPPPGACNGLAHVAVGADRRELLGLGPLVSSIFSSSRSPHCIHVHVFREGESSPQSKEAIRRIGRGSITVRALDSERFLLLRNLSSSSALNLARFYLPELLPETAASVLWVDADIIVRSDVHSLLAGLFTGANRLSPLAAVARDQDLVTHYRGGLERGLRRLRSPAELALDEAWGYDMSAILRGDAFNAGVTAFNLRQWRAEKLTQRVEALVPALQRLELASYRGISLPGGKSAAPSSQVPLQLLFGRDFQRLDACWNVGGLGTSWEAEELLPVRVWATQLHAWWTGRLASGCALHWTGGDKPWSGHNAFARRWYTPAAKAAAREGYDEIFPPSDAHWSDRDDPELLARIGILAALVVVVTCGAFFCRWAAGGCSRSFGYPWRRLAARESQVDERESKGEP